MITFYGHFSGVGSYVVVCNALSTWMTERGIEYTKVDLRSSEMKFKAERYQIGYDVGQDEKEGTALLLGFPPWWLVVPKHEKRIGFHVADFNHIPPVWSDVMGQLDHVLTPSRYLKKVFRKTIDIPIDVIPHGISSLIKPKRKNLQSKKIQFHHFCTAMEPTRKGTLPLIDSFEKLDDERAELTIWSDSPVVEERCRKAKPSIKLERQRFLSEQNQIYRLQSIDCLVAPSLAEGFGIIPLESLACGTPVVMSDITGHTEYTDSIRGGAIFVDPFDKDSILEGLVQACDNWIELSNEAYKYAQGIIDSWTWDHVLDESKLTDILAV